MAACTHRVTTPDTGASPNTSGAFTPAVSDLLVVFVIASATDGANSVLSSSVGLTFAKVLTATYGSGASAGVLQLFIATALIASATSQTVTWTDTVDPSSGTVITVYSVSGMTQTGAAAARQTAQQNAQGAGTTPAPSFGASALTDNPTLGAVGNFSNPAALTPPTSWTEDASADTGYNTPTTGLESVFRDSGFTGTTITWGSTSATEFCDIIVELDTSAEVGQPLMRRRGGTPFVGGQGIRGSSGSAHDGKMWGRQPRRFQEAA